MTKPHLHRLLIAAAIVAAFSVAANAGSGDSVLIIPPACHGSIAECMTDGGIEGGEFEMDSETNRRTLAAARTSSYIGYGSLKPNQVPCSRKGNSYYSACKPGKANPYHRGCPTVTKCKRGG